MLKLFIFQSRVLCLHFVMKGLSDFFYHLWHCLSSLLYFHFEFNIYLGFNIFRVTHCLTIFTVKFGGSQIWGGLRSNSVQT